MGIAMVDIFKRLAPFATIKTADLSASTVMALARAFNVPLSEAAAAGIAEHAPKFSSNPEEMLLEFVLNGTWLKMIAGLQPVKRGELIRRCNHCDGLLIPPPE